MIMRYKICFWLNVPSNHQTLFLEALNQDEQIDLQVRYFDKPNEDRLKMGWRDENSLHEYEQYVNGLDDALKTLNDWKERIHIVIGYGFPFNRELIPALIKNRVKWVHWSERYGIGLAKKLNYNVTLFEWLRPLFLTTKRSYGKLVNQYALGCFSQGFLARRDFKDIGIDDKKISDLYYTTEAKRNITTLPSIFKNFKYSHKFLYVGRLSRAKGTKELLIAFSKLDKKEEWGLVLVGTDESNGDYAQLSQKLGIANKVLFVGNVHAQDISSYYNHADIFLFPTRYDGWGAVISEACSLGLPIIASDQCGASYHMVKNNENGYITKA